ncbi:MAG: hypothetical protein ACFFG0_27655 [Candidatus Thorarchaeota archaeon]
MEGIKYTIKQLELLKVLSEQTFCEKNLHKIYQGSLLAMKYIENPENLHQAAHSLRELSILMIRHIEIITQENNEDTHREKMKKFLKELDELGGIEKEAIIKQWHKLHNYFIKVAHHGFDIIDQEEFEQNLEYLENIILSILGPVYDSIKELDILIEKEKPTKEDLEKAISFIKNLSQYEYFFKNLKDPIWLELLDEKGFFGDTPKFGERSIEPLFLLKVAKVKSDKVLEIIKRHKETDHPGAQINYIKSLIDMPIEYGIQMIKIIKKWINSLEEYTPSIYYTLVEFIGKLVDNNKDEELFDLLNSFFAIKKEILDHDENVEKILKERWNNVDVNNYDFNKIYEIYDDKEDLQKREESQSYIYEDLIKKILPKLMEKYPIKTLYLFLIKLKIANNFFLKNTDDRIIEDYSLAWYSNLDEKPIGKDFRKVLVEIIKGILNIIGNNYEVRFSEVINELRKLNYLIFRRLEYYCYNNSRQCYRLFLQADRRT